VRVLSDGNDTTSQAGGGSGEQNSSGSTGAVQVGSPGVDATVRVLSEGDDTTGQAGSGTPDGPVSGLATGGQPGGGQPAAGDGSPDTRSDSGGGTNRSGGSGDRSGGGSGPLSVDTTAGGTVEVLGASDTGPSASEADGRRLPYTGLWALGLALMGVACLGLGKAIRPPTAA
jgi:hypothetical protein